jgi:hypothetical protein
MYFPQKPGMEDIGRLSLDDGPGQCVARAMQHASVVMRRQARQATSYKTRALKQAASNTSGAWTAVQVRQWSPDLGMHEMLGAFRWLEAAASAMVDRGAYRYGAAVIDANHGYPHTLSPADHTITMNLLLQELKMTFSGSVQVYDARAMMAEQHPQGLVELWERMSPRITANFLTLLDLDANMGSKALKPPVRGRIKSMSAAESKAWRAALGAHMKIKGMVHLLIEFAHQWESGVRRDAMLAWSESQAMDQMEDDRPDTPGSETERKAAEWWATLQLMLLRQLHGMRVTDAAPVRSRPTTAATNESSMPDLIRPPAEAQSPTNARQVAAEAARLAAEAARFAAEADANTLSHTDLGSQDAIDLLIRAQTAIGALD